MTKLDDAIKLCTDDVNTQSQFYDLFLNSLFYVPIVEEKDKPEQEDGALPLLVEANDKTYLMLFDTINRLTDWANDKAKYLAVTGQGITEMSSSNIYWVLNYDTDFQKFFDLKEIAWLKDIVRRAKEKSQKQSSTDIPNSQDDEAK
ncbi:MAG: SseB family protein [Desulfuromonadales bacterium]|nr:SseB family protein [Desulfuromonadales bacterium]